VDGGSEIIREMILVSTALPVVYLARQRDGMDPSGRHRGLPHLRLTADRETNTHWLRIDGKGFALWSTQVLPSEKRASVPNT